MQSTKPYSEYAERNSGPILDVLQKEFADAKSVLEIGSGTGQHAVTFAASMPFLTWQTSDREENHGAIAAWIKDSDAANVLPPLLVDVATAELPGQTYSGVFSANTAHIMSFDEVKRMFALVGNVLHPGGRFCLYGPFRLNGEFNAPSNAAFHASLQYRNPHMGIRDLADLDSLGRQNDLSRAALYAMPANNSIAVWHKVIS